VRFLAGHALPLEAGGLAEWLAGVFLREQGDDGLMSITLMRWLSERFSQIGECRSIAGGRRVPGPGLQRADAICPITQFALATLGPTPRH